MPITASEGSAKFAATRPDLDDVIKRRFFYRQAFEIYGGCGGFYTCGPQRHVLCAPRALANSMRAAAS